MVAFIGIDPGWTGGVAVIWGDDNLYTTPIPVWTMKNGREAIDEPALVTLVRQLPTPAEITLEDLSARPGTGAAAMLRFGAGWGIIRGVLAAEERPYILVRPQEWKPAMLKIGRLKYTEATRAKMLWPEHNFLKNKRARKPHGGMVDAALMAAYGRVLHEKRKALK